VTGFATTHVPQRCATGWWLWWGTAVLCGCVQSAVPSLDASDFKRPVLAELTPRALAVQVRDERPVSPEDRRETEEHLRAVLGQLLGSAGVSVSAQARYGLVILLRYPEHNDLGMDPVACVEMSWDLRAADVSASTSTNSACSEVEDGYGAAAPNISRAFRRAIRAQLSTLEGTAAEAVVLAAPLDFDSAQLSVPRFAWLTSRTLALEVKDELGDAGAAGTQLTSSLTEALTRSGLLITDQAKQRLSITLARPGDSHTEHERRTCVEVKAEVLGSTGRRFVSRQDCPRRGAPLGPRVVNGALLGLDSL
jgi:hypothetical protein